MASTDLNFTPFMTEGADPFSRQVQTYHRMIEAVSPLVLDFLDKVTPTPGQPFVIGDYGTADGGTSYSLIQEVISRLRQKHGVNLPIQVVYEDQPINDFKTTFLRAQGLIPGIQGLTSQFSNVYVTATGTSFYSQCVPPNSVDFVVCLCATHWLSKSPYRRSATLFPTIVNGPLRQSFEKQAEEDWEKFLLMRGKELKPGGYLVVASLARSPDERLTVSTPEVVMAISSRVWQGMLEDGLIQKTEFEQTQFPLHIRSREELKKPFKDDQSPVSMSGLKLVCMEKKALTTYFNNAVEGRENVQSYLEEQRAWQETTLLQGLAEQRSPADKQAIISAFYERYLEVVVQDSIGLRTDFVYDVFVIRKDNLSSTSQDPDVVCCCQHQSPSVRRKYHENYLMYTHKFTRGYCWTN